jgi:hypothetical protein
LIAVEGIQELKIWPRKCCPSTESLTNDWKFKYFSRRGGFLSHWICWIPTLGLLPMLFCVPGISFFSSSKVQFLFLVHIIKYYLFCLWTFFDSAMGFITINNYKKN